MAIGEGTPLTISNRVLQCLFFISGRSQAAVCSYKGQLYAFGGTDSWNCYSSAEIYNPSTNSWRFATRMSQARRGAAVAVFNGKQCLMDNALDLRFVLHNTLR